MASVAPGRNSERRTVILYLTIAYGWSWALWLPTVAIAHREGWLMPGSDRVAQLFREGLASPLHGWAVAAFTAAVYGPLVAAKIAAYREGGSAAVGVLARKLVRVRLPPREYLLAFGLAAFVAAVPPLLGSVLPGPRASSAVPVSGTWFLAVVLHQLLTSGLGEEPGWRGYLMPRLQARIAGDGWVWPLGLAWSVWHWPFIAMVLAPTLPADAPFAAGAVLLTAFAGNVLALVGMSYLYGWLFARTRSIFVMMVFHALTNALPLLIVGGGHPAAGLIAGVTPWLLVLALKRTLGPDAFPGRTVEATG